MNVNCSSPSAQSRSTVLPPDGGIGTTGVWLILEKVHILGCSGEGLKCPTEDEGGTCAVLYLCCKIPSDRNKMTQKANHCFHFPACSE